MDLVNLQKHWEEFGRTDPLWAILTKTGRKGGKWNPEQFFATGRKEIRHTMKKAGQLGLPAQRLAALDFGCGVGRLTQALCAHFERCCGVDIAPSMVDMARTYNQFADRCEYRVNTTGDLRQFADESFDFICSYLVLQHMEPCYAAAYLREFVRLLRPGGLIAFQLPDPVAQRHGATQAAGPLPDTAFRASIFTAPWWKLRAPANASLNVRAAVWNRGTHGWPSIPNAEGRFAVTLGNHWLTPDGTPVLWDDGRRLLKRDLEPGRMAVLAIPITTPVSPGRYVLELDMVQEGVGWFQEKGSPVLRVGANITPAVSPAPAAREFTPQMEMHGMRKNEVVEVLASAGARLVDIAEDRLGGPNYASYTYFATR